MFFFYILKCYKPNHKFIFYKGITNDIKRRFCEHRTGRGGFTKQFKGNVEIVYAEKFNSRSEARQREIEVKGFSRKQIFELLKKENNDSTNFRDYSRGL